MYVHRVNNGKRVPMYVCGNYAKQPLGTLCRSAHCIKTDHVMALATQATVSWKDQIRDDIAVWVRMTDTWLKNEDGN